MNTNRVKLNLAGLDGNAFSLMGAYKRAARQQGIDNLHVNKVIETCMSGDYDNLIHTLMENTEEENQDEEELDYGCRLFSTK